MQTVISAFKDEATATNALERLVQAGIARQNVHLQSGSGSAVTSTGSASNGSTASSDDDGFMSSVSHFFSNLFDGDSSSQDASTYSEAVRRGNTVVAVDVMDEDESDIAASIMDELGAVDIDTHASQWGATGWTAGGLANGVVSGLSQPANQGIAQPADQGATATDAATTMKVVQEELQVGKQVVERGGVRIIQRVSEVPVQEMVQLRSEKTVIERRPVDRVATEADFANLGEGTMEIRETAEEAVVEKKARVVEEVVVGKKVEDRTETISDKVRRKDVEVERLDEHALASNGSSDRTKDTLRTSSTDPLTPRD